MTSPLKTPPNTAIRRTTRRTAVITAKTAEVQGSAYSSNSKLHSDDTRFQDDTETESMQCIPTRHQDMHNKKNPKTLQTRGRSAVQVCSTPMIHMYTRSPQTELREALFSAESSREGRV
ncbi:unnamed protein product [Leuciscus chuanchicus]